MRKIIGIIFCLLMIFNTTLPISSHIDFTVKQESNKQNYPDDFELDAFSGGFPPWTKLFRLQIDPDGNAVYSIMYPEDRGSGIWTIISNFVFSSDELSLIWSAIEENDFFGLNNIYEGSEADGTFANMKILADNQFYTVKTENIGVRRFDDIIRTINSQTPGSYDLFYNALFNLAPEKPNTPSGVINGKARVEYTYSTSTTDYNVDPIYYLFSWGDGTDSGWVGPFNSSEIGFAKHKWKDQGSYNITVIAKDDPNGDGDLSDGLESMISDPLPISIPKTKNIVFLNLFLYGRLINTLQFFKKLLSNDETDHIPLFAYFDNSGTQVTINDCNITVTIRIQIHGPGATVALTQEMESEIESVWNTDSDGNSWKIPCASDCERHQPGCNVKFDAAVVRMPAGEVLPGFHDIEVGKDNSADGDGHISTVDTPLPQPNSGSAGSGNWDDNEPAGTWAHETGHLMGLKDEYNVTSEDPYETEPNPGHKNDIMANLSGKPTQDAIEDVVANGGVECPCKCCPEPEVPPDVQITSPANHSTIIGSVTVTGVASTTGVRGRTLCINLTGDSGSSHNCENLYDPPEKFNFVFEDISFDYLTPDDDWMKITVNVTDTNDNVGYDWIIVYRGEEEDNTPPVTTKTIGQPQDEGGYIIWPITPITLTATDDLSGVNHIHYEVWWDSNGDQIVDTQVASENVYSSSTMFTVGSYGVFFGLIQLKYYAVDNAQNQEQLHKQNHMVMEG